MQNKNNGIVFNEKEFWPMLLRDVAHARSRLIIESPYVVKKRLDDLEVPMKKLIARGGAVCIFVQEVSEWTKTNLGSQKADELQHFVDRLKSWNVHVTLRKQRHVKIIVLDRDILWDGSLNLLAHNAAGERMRRYKSSEEVKAAIEKERLFECVQCRENISKYTIDDRVRKQVVDWGQLFKDRREDRDLSQQDVAEVAGVAKSMISRLERGHQPLFETTLRAHQALGAEILSLPDYFIPAVGNLLAKIEKAE